MSRAVSFRQADVERLLRAAKAVGYEQPSVKITLTGDLLLLTAPQADEKPLSPLEAWEREHGDRAA